MKSPSPSSKRHAARAELPMRMAHVGARWTRRLASEQALLVGAGALVLLLLMGTLFRLVWTISPTAVDLGQALRPPSLEHPMGTDAFGRDILARFAAGAAISLLVGFAVAAVGAVIGSAVGVIAGVFGGSRDAVLMRVMDAILAFPPLILAMVVTVGLGVGIVTAAIGIMLTSIPWYARVLRSEVLRLRGRPYVEASLTMGATSSRTIRRHILPHLVPTLLIQAAAVFSYGILALAALGFVGLGAQIPAPDWGAMITDGLPHALAGNWWVAFFPGLGVLIATAAAAILADRARDILDPRGQYVGI